MALEHVEIAREWIGTPYRHQASVRGVGCDCLGLVRGIWRATVGPEPMIIPSYTPDWDEYDGSEVLFTAALEHLDRKSVDPSALGDVLLFRMRRRAVAKHLAVLSSTSEVPRMIHAISGRAVAETTLTPDWRKRIVAQFAFPQRRA